MSFSQSKWLQVSSSPQDSSQYFGRSQQYCSLVVFGSSNDFQFLQFPEGCSKWTNYKWYWTWLSCCTLFFFSSKVQVLVDLFVFFYFQFVVRINSKIHKISNSLSFFFSFIQGLIFWVGFTFQNPNRFFWIKEFYASDSLGLILGCTHTIWLYCQSSFFCTIPTW